MPPVVKNYPNPCRISPCHFHCRVRMNYSRAPGRQATGPWGSGNCRGVVGAGVPGVSPAWSICSLGGLVSLLPLSGLCSLQGLPALRMLTGGSRQRLVWPVRCPGVRTRLGWGESHQEFLSVILIQPLQSCLWVGKPPFSLSLPPLPHFTLRSLVF